MKVTVKQEHISGGISSSQLKCPIALAAKDAGIKVPVVNYGWLLDACRGKYYRLPQQARDFQLSFDSGRDVCPFEFDTGAPKMQPIKVVVTQKHIDEGVPCEYAYCPIVYVKDADCTTAYELPDIAGDFIRNFDSGKKVKPFTLELEEE